MSNGAIPASMLRKARIDGKSFTGGGRMGSFEIPLWVMVFGVFLAVAAIFLLASWKIIIAWIADGLKGKGSQSAARRADGDYKPDPVSGRQKGD